MTSAPWVLIIDFRSYPPSAVAAAFRTGAPADSLQPVLCLSGGGGAPVAAIRRRRCRWASPIPVPTDMRRFVTGVTAVALVGLLMHSSGPKWDAQLLMPLRWSLGDHPAAVPLRRAGRDSCSSVYGGRAFAQLNRRVMSATIMIRAMPSKRIRGRFGCWRDTDVFELASPWCWTWARDLAKNRLIGGNTFSRRLVAVGERCPACFPPVMIRV